MMRLTILLTARRCLLALAICWAAPLRADIAVNARTAVLIDAREPAPIQKAARDLASDMQSVFGRPALWAHQASEAPATVVCIAFEHNLPPGVARPRGWETLRIQAVNDPWPGSPVRQAVVLTGSDVRGVIYAIYEFSRKFLGVDPFYWWTDHPPPRRARVTVASGFLDRQGPPTFRYRGWFLNDEDLLTGWRPGNADHTGISLAVWDRIYEALLRLKGDMVVPGTFLFPDEPQVRAAGERGLIITQHHMEPLGLNVYRWPEGQPYTLDRLAAAWNCSVSQYPREQEIVWTLGLRGRYDHPFWRDIPNAPDTPAGRAGLIRKAIGQQMETVRRQRPSPPPEFILNSWMEGSQMIRDGILRLPPDVHLVWADDGAGLLQDGGLIGPGQGVYYHTAVIGGNANNFTERVPVPRIARELGRAVRAGATHYFLLNPSDVRPVVMTTHAVMDLVWNAGPWLADSRDAAASYLADWCRREFGDRAAPLIEQYYCAYFDAPARYGEKENAVMADNFYQQLARDLLVRMIRGDKSSPVRFRSLQLSSYSEYTDRLRTICRDADGRWEKAALLAEKAAPLVPAERREFFQAHVLTQLEVHRRSNRMLLDLAEGEVNAAIPEIQAVLKALQRAGYGRWQGFYTRGDWFVNVPLTLQLAEVCRSRLQGRPLSAAQEKIVETAEHYLNADTSSVFIRIKAYQEKQRVQFCSSR